MTENATPPRKRPLYRRVLRWIVVIAAVLLTIDFIGLPMFTGIYAAWPHDENVGDPPEDFRELDLHAVEDGTRLAAWYRPPDNGAAIILLSGAGGNRDDVRAKAVMLAEHGYGVLALDLRGTGESAGGTNLFGWEGTQDVGAAVEFLAAQDAVQHIGAWGISLGGEVLLGAAGDYPQMTAIIADGATVRSHEEKTAIDANDDGLPWVHSWLTYAFVGLFTGDDPPTPILDSLRATDQTQFLLIAAGKVDNEITFNRLYQDTLGEDRAGLWIVPDVGHTGGYDRYTDEYSARVLAFFEAALLLNGSP